MWDGQVAFQDEGTAGQSCTHALVTSEGQKETHVAGGCDEGKTGRTGDGGGNGAREGECGLW